MTGGLALWQSLGPQWSIAVVLSILLTSGYAHLSGDTTARVVGNLALVMVGLDVALAEPQLQISRGSTGPDHAGIDLLYLSVLVVLSLRTQRFYPLGLAAAQLLVVIVHVLINGGLLPDPKIVRSLLAVPTALLVPAFIFGALRARKPWLAAAPA